ncbi:unnamed protein product [Fusarium graminearum]|nr:unnamed protein product [Fusarium graminearum]CAG1992148.1 unnamed protein product [Fusarium graminearum]VTO89068.1 unnamed protein product [Fusarium graminearum]
MPSYTAAFPLLSSQIYRKFNNHRAYTLLVFLKPIMMPFPYRFFCYQKRITANSCLLCYFLRALLVKR